MLRMVSATSHATGQTHTTYILGPKGPSVIAATMSSETLQPAAKPISGAVLELFRRWGSWVARILTNEFSSG